MCWDVLSFLKADGVTLDERSCHVNKGDDTGGRKNQVGSKNTQEVEWSMIRDWLDVGVKQRWPPVSCLGDKIRRGHWDGKLRRRSKFRGKGEREMSSDGSSLYTRFRSITQLRLQQGAGPTAMDLRRERGWRKCFESPHGHCDHRKWWDSLGSVLSEQGTGSIRSRALWTPPVEWGWRQPKRFSLVPPKREPLQELVFQGREWPSL